MGAAWPFERMKVSTLRASGSRGSQRISWKKRAATSSAQDMHEVGCPEPASVVMRMTRRRSRRAISARGLASAWMRASSHFFARFRIEAS